jgi:hypothetical protein
MVLYVVALLAGSGWAIWNFGPNTGGAPSRETTFILAPLEHDGLPNYALAILDAQRKNVTPDSNAAAEFWQIVGPGEMDAKEFRLLCQELRITPDPTSHYLTVVRSDEVRHLLEEWLRDQGSAFERERIPAETALPDGGDEVVQDPIKDLWDEVARRPWSATECPPLAEWVAANDALLDRLVSAASRPNFYSPPPNLLANASTPAYDMLIPHVQAARNAARSLVVRSTHRVAHQRFDEAWQDCLAIWRLGELVARGPTVFDYLFGIAIRGVARDATLALLQSEGLPVAAAEKMLHDLSTLAPDIQIVPVYDFGERCLSLDLTLRLMTRRLDATSVNVAEYMEINPSVVRMTSVLAFDLDAALKAGNQLFDRIVAVAALSDVQTRQTKAIMLETEMYDLARLKREDSFALLFSRSRRSELVGQLCAIFMGSGFTAALKAEDRDATGYVLIRVAAALALHRAQHGSYPDALAELTPELLDKAPRDPFSNQPLLYARRGDGYILYSVFTNGVDDGGLSFDGKIVGGEWANGEENREVDYDHSDFVIRMPRPHRPLQVAR